MFYLYLNFTDFLQNSTKNNKMTCDFLLRLSLDENIPIQIIKAKNILILHMKAVSDNPVHVDYE